MAFLAGLTDDGLSGAPIDFQISSSSSGSECGPYEIRSLYEREKCPLCCKLKKNFYCKDCLKSGDFWHSSSSGDIRERFRELQFQLLQKQQERDEILAKCMDYTKPRERALLLVEKIEEYERTITLQKQLKAEVERRLGVARQESALIKKQNDEKIRIWPLYRSRLNTMNQERMKRDGELRKRRTYVQERGRDLQNLSKARIMQLKQYIFPIQEVYGDSVEGRMLSDKLQSSSVTLMSSNDSWSDEDDDTVRSLIAATSTRTGGGYSPNDLTCKFGLSHSISGALGPALPISGDYSAYNTYTEGVHTGSGSSQVRNPAHVISAGLTFLTQFVNMISYYLDLRLPHRLSYSEFSVGCLANRKFNRKVAKLNANVVHLCTSQGVPASYLQPRKTISNLLLLFDSSLVGVCQLGARGPFEVAIQLARSMEESMEKDLVIYEEDSSESDNEYNDYFPSDWETVHRGSITEEMSQLQYMTRQPSYMQSVDSDSFIRSRTSSSIAGNLVSSVTSFFRGWNT